MIVRKLRLEKGLSQEQLADMAGISTRTLQRLERGAKASPETLKCIASVLETDFANLRKEQNMTTEATSPTSADFPKLSNNEREAMEYVRDIRSFYVHAAQYCIVMVGLLILNLVTNPDYIWVLWPALGWGVAVTLHGLSVFEIITVFGHGWEKRQIAQRMRRR